MKYYPVAILLAIIGLAANQIAAAPLAEPEPAPVPQRKEPTNCPAMGGACSSGGCPPPFRRIYYDTGCPSGSACCIY
ncbi:hypothetical protein VTO42DRAFT_3828 [Malbranchea cinnamomea]